MLLILFVSLICAGAIFYRYFRARRPAAGAGWVFIIVAIGGSGSGLAGSFAWSGLVFLFLGAAGLLVVLQEAFFRRQERRKRQQQSRAHDLEHRI